MKFSVSHRDHDHENSPAARARCRADVLVAQAAAQARIDRARRLITQFNHAGYSPRPGYWLDYAASHFCKMHDGTDLNKALAVLDYFKKTDYQPTESVYQIARVTYRCAS